MNKTENLQSLLLELINNSPMKHQNAENKAAKLLKELDISIVPIDLKMIAEHYGIRISEAPNDDHLSGLLLKSNGKTIIGVNSLHHKNRKRFTIAHELGHYCLHQSDTFVDKIDDLELLKFRHDSLPQTEEEREANTFAAALLMPADILTEHFNRLKDVVNDLEELLNLLSKKYEVSIEAMRYRLLNLNLVQSF